jgi:hypothetical protein
MSSFLSSPTLHSQVCCHMHTALHLLNLGVSCTNTCVVLHCCCAVASARVLCATLLNTQLLKVANCSSNSSQADAAAPIPGALSNWAVINLVAPVRPPANQPSWAVYNTSSVSGCLMSDEQHLRRQCSRHAATWFLLVSLGKHTSCHHDPAS